MPLSLEMEMDGHRGTRDPVAAFVKFVCVNGPGLTATTAELSDAYNQWSLPLG